uniref:Glycosyltransferase n=1 Tax=Caenorhabditis tropicalis TaxID=1561998 RepID=A0A1I7V430_9PELO
MDQMWPRGFPLEHLEKHTNGNSKQVSCYKMKRASVQQGLVHHDPDVDAIYRTTDIWRSFISQKILHLSGLTVSFVPTNAVQFRNAHYYLKDFKDEKQVYEDSGKMIELLHKWKCSKRTSLEDCIYQLTQDLVVKGLWGQKDANLMQMFLKDLKKIGFEFPDLVDENYVDPYAPSIDETSKSVNCRRMNLEFDLINPKDDGKTVLIVVNNYPWEYGVGLIQRLYQPYFASIIFCGSWYPDQIEDEDNFTSTIHPVNYIHMNPAEMTRGYFGYHCLTLVKEMGLSNVEGYFFMADDTVFNLWQRIDYSRVHHLHGYVEEPSYDYYHNQFGLTAAKNIIESMKNNNDPKLEKAWKRFENGLKKYGFIKENGTAEDEMMAKNGKSISDFFYVPTSESDYYATLMRRFFEHDYFLELAVNIFLKSVNHQTSYYGIESYLWHEVRLLWDRLYSKNMVGMHPVKVSEFRKPGEQRRKYCATILHTWANIMFEGNRNFTTKADNDVDDANG